MFTLDPPLLVSVTICDCLDPTVTLPKSSLAGLSMSCPGDVPVPVPDSVRFVTVFDASLVIESVALKAPTALGMNLMLIVVLCPAAMASGRLGATREKYLVEIEALLTVTDAGPGFVAVTVRVLLLPAATFPKSRVVLSRERVLDCCWPEEPAALTPWQPTRKVRPARRSNAPASFPRCFERIALAAVSSIVSHGTVAPGSTTVCTRGRAHHESGAACGIAVDLRGTPCQPPEG
jgi:hypothetical protein